MASTQLLGRVRLGAPRRGIGRRTTVQVAAVAAPMPSPMHGRNVDHGSADPVFYDKQGQRIKAMPADYGFRSGSGRLYEEHYGQIPDNVWDLAAANLQHEFAQLRSSFRYPDELDDPPTTPLQKVNAAISGTVVGALAKVDEALEGAGLLPKLDPPPELTEAQMMEFDEIRHKLAALRLDAAAVTAQERDREAREGELDTPLFLKAPFQALCWVLDIVYDKRPIQKFWVLEVVARIPYMAYVSILHLYESLGFWRAGAELRKVHFAEEWNEMHHLQIMESLGGDRVWVDRFFAQHTAIVYYWLLFAFYLISPKLSYNFMERVEHHAFDTYTVFVQQNQELLATIPPPQVALNYYKGADLYLFDQFQGGHKGAPTTPRRPECSSLLDVFTNIRDDENEHVKTMEACSTGGMELIAGDEPGRDA